MTMKRLLTLAAAVAILGATNVQAQVQVKVDEAAINKKIAKSDADIQNEKKNVKPAVWIERGKVFAEAASAPVNGLYVGLDEATMVILFGKIDAENKSVGDVAYSVFVYPDFDVYVQNGKVVFWDQKKVIAPNALDKAVEAYKKAYEIDKSAKVTEGLNAISQIYKQDAGNYFSIQKFVDAAKAFRSAYEVQILPAVNVIDTASIFNAGFLYTASLDYANGLESLKEAHKYNYENNGELYYYMFHCYYGLKDNENAKKILLEGITKYPANNHIVEGLLSAYSGENDDPKEIIPVVEKAIASDPTNTELLGGLGRIYDKLGDLDKSIESFSKAVAIAPDEFSNNFNLGLMFIKKADILSTEIGKKTFTSQKEYDEAITTANDVYAQSIAPLEKAFEANPSEGATIELLKNVAFRLRERDGVMAKYEKYNELHKARQQ